MRELPYLPKKDKYTTLNKVSTKQVIIFDWIYTGNNVGKVPMSKTKKTSLMAGFAIGFPKTPRAIISLMQYRYNARDSDQY